MFRNYLKTAWRNLVRHKSFSITNIAGLALGMTCSLLIMLWIQDERSVDAFHQNGRQLYQVYERAYYDGKIEASYPTQGLLAGELKKTIPEIKYASGLEPSSAPGTLNTFEANGKIIKMAGNYAGEDFFNMFSFPLIQGTAASALNTPASIAISKKMASAFFGTPEQAIGKTLRLENKTDLKVSAVFENLPSHSSMHFDFLRTWIDFVKENEWVHNWGNSDPQSFVQLRPDADPARIEKRIKDFIYRYKEKSKGFVVELGLQPFPEKYLHSNFGSNGQLDGGRIEYIRLFTIVAIFILMIACINYMNLATAQSSKRAKEVGLRKVIGAMRSALTAQFIGEALLLTMISALISVAAVILLLPGFNTLTGKQIDLGLIPPAFWALLAVIVLATGLIAGSYPAFFLSSLQPVKVLKGSLQFNWKDVLFRKGLVVFQFSLSIVLMVSMIIIYRQMNYIQTKNLGYDRDNLVYIPVEGELIKNYALFKTEASRMTAIVGISKMRNSPTVISHHTGSISWPGKDPNLTVGFADGVIGYDFVKTMKLQLKAGRDFSKDFASDSSAFLINETAANRIGYRDPLGQTLIWGNHPGKIIGVLKDFHFNSMHEDIEPLIVRLDEQWPWGTILVRTRAGKTKEAIADLERLCKSLNPKFPFTYQFSDLEFQNLYQSEQIVSKLSDYFAFIAIFISCLGLFGLTTFTVAQRTKEIGVRKVLGASAPRIVAMLSGGFLGLIAWSMLLAFPVAWWAMKQWLQNFAYKIDIGWSVFALAGLATIAIALITVGYQAVKAAVANPVDSLRAE